MIKRILLTLLQFIVFIVLLAIGGYWDIIHLLIQMRAPSLNVIPLIKFQITSSHVLVANGLIFATVLLVLVLLFLLLRKKLHPWAWLSLLAYALAVCLGFAMKLGLPPADSSAQSRLSAPCLTPQDASLVGHGCVSTSDAIGTL